MFKWLLWIGTKEDRENYANWKSLHFFGQLLPNSCDYYSIETTNARDPNQKKDMGWVDICLSIPLGDPKGTPRGGGGGAKRAPL